MAVPLPDNLDPLKLAEGATAYFDHEREPPSWISEDVDGKQHPMRLTDLRRHGLDYTTDEFRQHAQRCWNVSYGRFLVHLQDAVGNPGDQHAQERVEATRDEVFTIMIDLSEALLDEPPFGL